MPKCGKWLSAPSKGREDFRYPRTVAGAYWKLPKHRFAGASEVIGNSYRCLKLPE